MRWLPRHVLVEVEAVVAVVSPFPCQPLPVQAVALVLVQAAHQQPQVVWPCLLE